MDDKTCFHEAAHAVIALSYGVRVTELKIGGEQLGGVAIAGVCDFIPADAPKLVLAEIYLAGPAIESMMDPYWNLAEVKDDYDKAAELLVGADVTAVVSKVKWRISNLYPEIDRLAKALLEHKRLDKREILRAARLPSWLRGV